MIIGMSSNRFLITFSIVNDPGVSPGCTLADNTITFFFLDSSLVIVTMGTINPPKVLHNISRLKVIPYTIALCSAQSKNEFRLVYV